MVVDEEEDDEEEVEENKKGKIRNCEMPNPKQVCTWANYNCLSGTLLTQLTRRNQPACCSSFVFSEIIQRWIHLKLSLFNVYQQKDLLTKWCPMFINGKCSHPSCDKTPSSVWHVHALNTFDKNRESTPSLLIIIVIIITTIIFLILFLFSCIS